MKKWRTYMPDQEILGGGVVILEILRIGRNQETTESRVQFTCCRRFGVLSHAAIRRRIGNDTRRCTHCRRPGTNSSNTIQGEHVPTATWPVPPTLQHLPHPWSEE